MRGGVCRRRRGGGRRRGGPRERICWGRGPVGAAWVPVCVRVCMCVCVCVDTAHHYLREVAC